MLDVQAAASFNQLWFRLGRSFPEHEFYTMQPRRMSIDNMRNAAAKTALELECDYLWFIDDDVLVEPRTVFGSLLEGCEKHKFDVLMAETYIRGYPFQPMFFQHNVTEKKLDFYWDFEKDVNKKTGLLECAAVGFSCVLIKCELIKKITKPYFATGVLGTEDVYFCMKCRSELGENRVKIGVDTKVPTGHLLDPEPLHKLNRKALLKYYETVYPHLKLSKNNDRGAEYAKAVKQVVKTREAQIKSGLRDKQNQGNSKSGRGKKL